MAFVHLMDKGGVAVGKSSACPRNRNSSLVPNTGDVTASPQGSEVGDFEVTSPHDCDVVLDMMRHDGPENTGSGTSSPPASLCKGAQVSLPDPGDPAAALGIMTQKNTTTSIISSNQTGAPQNQRRTKYTLLEATAFNTMNMFGTGPFITIPLVICAVAPAGPHALLGYGVMSAGCILDSLIWGELGSRWPASGGSYVYLRQLYGPNTWGRLMAFLYVWQFLLTAPMELASGSIAIAQYLSYLDGDASYWHHSSIACSLCAFQTLLLYRGVEDVGRISLLIWVCMLGTIGFVLVSGFAHFHPEWLQAPEEAFASPSGFVIGMGAAMRLGIYDFTGYYDVCQMGGEVERPRRTIPLACVRTCIVVAVIYALTYLAVLGAIPWDGPEGFAKAAADESEEANYVMALFAERLLGPEAAVVVVIFVCVSIFGANFAFACGAAYVPCAAADGGHFFSWLGHRHSKREGLADYSLLLIGGSSCLFCFFRLGWLVDVMMTLLVPMQFLSQSVGLFFYRRREEEARKKAEAGKSLQKKLEAEATKTGGGETVQQQGEETIMMEKHPGNNACPTTSLSFTSSTSKCPPGGSSTSCTKKSSRKSATTTTTSPTTASYSPVGSPKAPKSPGTSTPVSPGSSTIKPSSDEKESSETSDSEKGSPRGAVSPCSPFPVSVDSGPAAVALEQIITSLAEEQEARERGDLGSEPGDEAASKSSGEDGSSGHRTTTTSAKTPSNDVTSDRDSRSGEGDESSNGISSEGGEDQDEGREDDRSGVWMMPFFPWPIALQIAIFSFALFTSAAAHLALATCALVAGTTMYLVWVARRGSWPFHAGAKVPTNKRGTS